MLDQWRRQRAARRVKVGDGRHLKRFRWWQLFSRSLFHLPLHQDDGRTALYSVDVRHWGGKEDGEVRADLYLDGTRHAHSRMPAAFPVPGGHVEVAMSSFGLRRCHHVPDDGADRQLVPDPRSAEGRRARLDREHPALSRWIGAVSIALLVVGLGLNLLQALEPLSQIPPVNDVTGTFTSPVLLPLWLNITLGVGAALGSAERALRLRYSWLDDAGN
ncbi:hypothetical protein [Nocardiopsis sp. L17-MgMaSL7]|uniref:hypothetical protein n=1 Tax=Nocardiopsis sp. L17-MgMaSL7 TaxID=1938893 RepID=UPI000D7099FC|nr:hypothetical protein [Nocardiopsis sp. L17-MgMaSL7]PWV46851.1 hypothetical protein BDW27_113160 [Nocardiopsis sp. L17-MgMaSL7]